jgi:hypothetical protein
LCGMVRERFADQVAGAVTVKGFTLKNGSRVEILPQSQKAVRGTRVQKMRCDEVELFDREVWGAAQLTTRSMLVGEDKGTGRGGDKERLVRGAVEVFSTMHRPAGLMAELVKRTRCPIGELGERIGGGGRGSGPPEGGTPNEGEAGKMPALQGRKVFTWCVWDVIGRCKEERACEGCGLWPSCQGRARGGAGFVPVRDVLAVWERSSRAAWDSEMLCHMPYAEDQVFGAFREGTHVRAFPAEARVGEVVRAGCRELRMEGVIGGIDYGWRDFACVWVALLRDEKGRRVAWVVDEYAAPERDLAAHAEAIRARGQVGGVALGRCVFYADVAGRQHDAHTGRTSEGVLKEAGLIVRSRPMQVEDGLRMVNGLLEPPETWGMEVVPRLLVDPRCGRVIEAMTGYVRKAGMPVKDGRHDHLADALRYAVVGQDGVGGKVVVRRY